MGSEGSFLFGVDLFDIFFVKFVEGLLYFGGVGSCLVFGEGFFE